jgi:hypothetical protein
MAPPHLPYDDVLRRIFTEIFILRNDRIEGETSSWLLSSTSVDLLSCALVARSWTLAAQQTLWRGIHVTTYGQVQKLLRTVESRPELPAQTRVVSVGVDAGEEENADELSKLLADIVEKCQNARRLELGRLHDSSRISVYDHIRSLERLEDLSWNLRRGGAAGHAWRNLVTFSELSGILRRHAALRRLQLELPTTFLYSSIHIPTSAIGITSLALQTHVPRIDFSIVGAVGSTLEQLLLYCERAIPSTLGAESLSKATATLRQLRLVSNIPIGREEPEIDWFEPLLPDFKALEKLSVTSDFLSPLAFQTLPPLLRWMELIDWTDEITHIVQGIEEIVYMMPNDLPLRHFVLCHDPDHFGGWEAKVDMLEVTLKEKGAALGLQGGLETPELDFFE